MFSSNCSNGSISTSCSFICAPNQSTCRPTSSLMKTYHPFGHSSVKLAIEVTTTSEEELRNRKYKEKCTRLQHQIRELVFVNNAIHSELNQCLDRLSRGCDERRFLLNKILHWHQDGSQDQAISSRILQEALSKKQSTKQSALSPSLPALISSAPILQNNNGVNDVERTGIEPIGSQCVSTQPLTQLFGPKASTDASLVSQSNPTIQSTQSFCSQTNSTQSGAGANKRIKLSESHTSANSI